MDVRSLQDAGIDMSSVLPQETVFSKQQHKVVLVQLRAIRGHGEHPHRKSIQLS